MRSEIPDKSTSLFRACVLRLHFRQRIDTNERNRVRHCLYYIMRMQKGARGSRAFRIRERSYMLISRDMWNIVPACRATRARKREFALARHFRAGWQKPASACRCENSYSLSQKESDKKRASILPSSNSIAFTRVLIFPRVGNFALDCECALAIAGGR